PPSVPTRFPYTTLFRSLPIADRAIALDPLSAAGYISESAARLFQGDHDGALAAARDALTISPNYAAAHHFFALAFLFSGAKKWRSEEHTSELQSPDHLV